MEQIQPDSKEVSLSWGRCVQNELSRDDFSPIIVQNEKLQKRLNENELLISIFKQAVEEINNLFNGNYFFLLTDPKGILLEMAGNKNIRIKAKELGIKQGISFAEESCGTNAISMSMKLDDRVYITPQQHYCIPLKKLHCFALPLWIDEQLVGYLDVSTIKEKLKEELIAIAELLEYKITTEYMIRKRARSKNKEVELTDKQFRVLRFLCQGLIEGTIAQKMECTRSNVKYHKRKIFEQLDVTCTREAIIKAIKLGLISVDEIEI